MVEIVVSKSLPPDSDGALRAALAEAAGARLERGLAHVASRLAQLSVGAPEDPLDELAGRVRAVLRGEEVASRIGEVGTRPDVELERFVLAQQIASPTAREVVTSFDVRDMEPRVAEALAAALAELFALVEAEGASCEGDACIFLTSARQDDEVVVAFAVRGVEVGAGSGDAASRSFLRAERLLRLVGGTLVRGVSNGMLVFGMLVPPAAPRGRGG